MNPEARLFTVSGRVQGVWYRDSTRREAERLGITGHAINLPDGNVEVLAWGAADALRELETWLRTGPPLARVTEVASKLPPTETGRKLPATDAGGKSPPTTFRIG